MLSCGTRRPTGVCRRDALNRLECRTVAAASCGPHTHEDRQTKQPNVMKLIIQIPCFNEEKTLPGTLDDLPREVPGVDTVEWLIIDDGSTDRTVEVAKEKGVDHIVSFSRNRGLAAAFRAGLQASLERGADVIVHTDADNQYCAGNIKDLVRPVIEENADMAIGDRQIWKHQEFGIVKKCLQKLGSMVVSQFSGISVPDAASGFRAYSREAAITLNVLSRYTYTHETIIQSGLHNLKVVSVPVQVNPKTRPSRLFRSIPAYLRDSTLTIGRAYTMYRSFKVFSFLATILFLAGFGIGVRFLRYYLIGEGGGHVQSLILATVLLNLSFVLFAIGVLAELIGCNRRLIEDLLIRMKKSEGGAGKQSGKNE